MRTVSINIFRDNAVGPALYRIDYGTKIQFTGIDIDGTYEVHFGKNLSDDAYRVLGDETGVAVPDILLQTDGTLYGWLYVHTGADDGWTKRSFTCRVKNRPNYTPAAPTPVQQDIIEQSIAALNAGVESVNEALDTVQQTVDDALQAAKDSGEFDGKDGYTPIKGVDYFDGEDGYTPIKGVDYSDGEDGYTPIKGVDYFDGEPGEPGDDGISPTVTVTDITGGHRITITDAEGPHSFDVMDGPEGAPGVGVPSGGTTGQVLSKASDTDYDTEWTTPSGGDVTDVQVNGVSVVSGGVANVPQAGNGVLGAVQTHAGFGVIVNQAGQIYIGAANEAATKVGTASYTPIVPTIQHAATFYGLAKAAGDTTQSASSNPVGQYTESAKSAISEMLNSPVAITGTTPSITALPGVRYVCGECATLDITLPASGCVDVVFESGSTPTVLTITPPSGVTLRWANGFDPTSLDANTTYEINIADGLGVAGQWT